MSDAAFRIDWYVDQAQWEYSRGVVTLEPAHGEYDRFGVALFRLINGELQLRYGAQLLFPPERLYAGEVEGRAILMEQGDPWYPIPPVSEFKGIYVSILDFAHQLELFIDQPEFRTPDPPVAARFHENDGLRVIQFVRAGGFVQMRHFIEYELHVPESEFFHGLQEFQIDFSQRVIEEVPQFLEWETFAGLRRYLNQ